MLSKEFIEQNRTDLIRVLYSSSVLFALLVGFNIGFQSSSRDLEIAANNIKDLTTKINLQNQQHSIKLKEIESLNEKKLLEFKEENKIACDLAIHKSLEEYKSLKCEKK